MAKVTHCNYAFGSFAGRVYYTVHLHIICHLRSIQMVSKLRDMNLRTTKLKFRFTSDADQKQTFKTDIINNV